MQNRWKSKYVWLGVLSQVLLVVGLFIPEISDTVKVIGTAVVETVTLLGILNNPSNQNEF